jgi:hypothetical protein
MPPGDALTGGGGGAFEPGLPPPPPQPETRHPIKAVSGSSTDHPRAEVPALEDCVRMLRSIAGDAAGFLAAFM